MGITQSHTDVDAFADRVFRQSLDAMETFAIYVGERLGLYRALADAGALSASAFATATGMHERYAREWLEQQAVAGVLAVTAASGVPRQFSLPAAHATVLLDQHSLAYTAPLARMVVAMASQMPELLVAYRSGGGVGWSEFGADARDAQGDVNRPWFELALAPALASVPTVHALLSRADARIADIGCGHGWSSIALARAYPDAVVEGFDVDAIALAAARSHASDLASVVFTAADAASLAERPANEFDVAFIFEALHDMPHPIALLRALHHAVKPGGMVVIMDEAVADAFAPNGDEIERVMYGYSLFMCLPDGMSTPVSAQTGTVMRRPVLEGYARAAGFAGAEVLPIEGFGAFRFYALSA